MACAYLSTESAPELGAGPTWRLGLTTAPPWVLCLRRSPANCSISCFQTSFAAASSPARRHCSSRCRYVRFLVGGGHQRARVSSQAALTAVLLPTACLSRALSSVSLYISPRMHLQLLLIRRPSARPTTPTSTPTRTLLASSATSLSCLSAQRPAVPPTSCPSRHRRCPPTSPPRSRARATTSSMRSSASSAQTPSSATLRSRAPLTACSSTESGS